MSAVRQQELSLIREMALVDEIARIITATLDIDQVYEEFAREMWKLVDVNLMQIDVIAYETMTFDIKFHYSSDPGAGANRTTDSLPLEGTPVHQVMLTGRTFVPPDPDPAAPAHRNIPGEMRAELRSNFTTPLTSKGRVIGALSLGANRAGAYGAREQAILERLASQIAPAIENARLYQEIRASEEKYRSLFAESNDAIYISTLEGRFVEINQATLDHLGYTREELLSLGPQDLYADPAVAEVFQRIMERTGSIRDFEAKLRRKDGTEIDCLLMATVHRTSDGAILGYQGSIHDITERKQLEARLLQAQKMESMGRLASSIAHDFNNILGSIQGFASLIRTRVSPASQAHEFAQIIENSSQRGAQLTQQLLTAATKTPFQGTLIDVNDAIHEVVQILTHTLPGEIAIVSNVQPGLPFIEGDMTQIHQALMNLCINAANAMPDGGSLSLSAEAAFLDEEFCRQRLSLEPGEYIQLKVQDTGVGISAADQPKIFEPFFTTKEPGKGTGLGLSVVYGVVNNHCGAIEVSSELNQGTTFTVYLPACQTAHAP